MKKAFLTALVIIAISLGLHFTDTATAGNTVRPDNSWIVIAFGPQRKKQTFLIEDAQTIEDAAYIFHQQHPDLDTIISLSRRSYVHCEIFPGIR